MGGKRIVLRTISEKEVPDDVVSEKTLYAMSGMGYVTLSCGNCMSTLVDGIIEGALDKRIIKCRKCGAYNKVRFPQLEIMKNLYAGQHTIISGSATTDRNIAYSLDMDIDMVRKELSEMISYDLVASEGSYFFLTRRGIDALRDLDRRMAK